MFNLQRTLCDLEWARVQFGQFLPSAFHCEMLRQKCSLLMGKCASDRCVYIGKRCVARSCRVRGGGAAFTLGSHVARILAVGGKGDSREQPLWILGPHDLL